MNTRHYKLIALLLVLAMVLGFVGSCVAYEPVDPGDAAVPPTIPTEPETTLSTEPTEPAPTEPTEPPAPAPQRPVTQAPLAAPTTAAKYAFIYDTRTEHYLYSNVPVDTAIFPASVTKLFTTYVALMYLDPQETVTIGNERNLVALDASIAGLQKGTTWTVEGLAYGALLPSGCDASYSLAAAAGRKILDDPKATSQKSIAAFMDECNRLAEEQGMTNTHFVTPDGYHDWNHYISIRGYTIIAQLILDHELLSEIAKTPQATVTYYNKYGTPYTTPMHNTNRTIHQEMPEFYRPESVGLKTGSTSAAGKCLLTAYQVEGGYLIVGVFGCIETTSRFTSANTLFDFFIEQRGAEYPYNKDPGITPGSFRFRLDLAVTASVI